LKGTYCEVDGLRWTDVISRTTICLWKKKPNYIIIYALYSPTQPDYRSLIIEILYYYIFTTWNDKHYIDMIYFFFFCKGVVNFRKTCSNGTSSIEIKEKQQYNIRYEKPTWKPEVVILRPWSWWVWAIPIDILMRV